jgi:hypothetical protein
MPRLYGGGSLHQVVDVAASAINSNCFRPASRVKLNLGESAMRNCFANTFVSIATILILAACGGGGDDGGKGGGGGSGGGTTSHTVGGTITGLTAAGLVLANGADTLNVAANATSFTMPQSVAGGSSYTIMITAQPTGLSCTLSNATGTMGAANVTNVGVACNVLYLAQWTDGFETYLVGKFPSTNWANSGNTQTNVTNTTAHGGSNSLFLYGVIGGDWAAIAHRQFVYSPHLQFDFYVQNGSETLTGLHQVYGTVALNTGPSWTYPGRGILYFGADGKIHGPTIAGGSELSGPVLGSFTAGQWYHVTITYDVLSSGELSLSYSIDGSSVGSFTLPVISGESSLSYIALQSGAGSAWFDDVSVATRN